MESESELSRYFSALVRTRLTESELREINRINAIPGNDAFCATHDCMDSNALMYGAYCALYFEPPNLESQDCLDEIGNAWNTSIVAKFAN